MRDRLVIALLLALSITPLVAAPGDHVWSFGMGGTATGDTAITHGIAVDTSGNTIIVGEFQGSANFGGSTFTSTAPDTPDIFIAKYNSSGVHQWSKQFGGSTADKGVGVGTDSSGNIYIVGSIGSAVNFGGGAITYSGNSDVFVLKLNSAGTYQFAYGFGGTGNDIPSGISVMANGTFAITGSFGNFGTAINFGGGALPQVGASDTFIAKFDSSGTHLWSRGQGASSSDTGTAIALDTGGNAYVTGYFQGTLTISSGPTRCPHSLVYTSAGFADIFVGEYTSSSGGLSWLHTYGGSTDDKPFGISIGPSGEVVIGGIFGAGPITFGGPTYSNNSNSNDLFFAKYNAGGGWILDKVIGVAGQTVGDQLLALGIDSGGNIIITGEVTTTFDFGGGILCFTCGTGDVFVVKYDSSANYLWGNRYGTTTYDEFATALAFDSSDGIHVTGYYENQEDFGGGALTPNGNPAINKFYGFLAKFLP